MSVYGVEIDPKLGLNILMQTFADYPEVANEWHPTKNGDIRPDQVRPKSDKKLWFLCSKVESPEWQADWVFTIVV